MLCLSTSECHGEKRITVQRMRKQMTGTMQAGGQYGGPPSRPPHFLSPSDTALADRIEHVGVSEGGHGKAVPPSHRLCLSPPQRDLAMPYSDGRMEAGEREGGTASGLFQDQERHRASGVIGRGRGRPSPPDIHFTIAGS